MVCTTQLLFISDSNSIAKTIEMSLVQFVLASRFKTVYLQHQKQITKYMQEVINIIRRKVGL